MRRATIFTAILFSTAAIGAATDFLPCRLVDDSFIERYALSSDRAALISTLQPKSEAWYVFSILQAQTEGRLADSSRLIAQWERARRDGDSACGDIAENLRFRQAVLECGEKPSASQLKKFLRVLDECGIGEGLGAGDGVSSAAAAPQGDPGEEAASGQIELPISFDDFWERCARRPDSLKEAYRHLALTVDGLPERKMEALRRHLPSEKGLMEAVLEYLKDADPSHVFERTGAMGMLTLDQLATVARETRLTPKDVRESEEYAKAVLERMPLPDGENAEKDAILAVLQKRVDFARTLSASLGGVKAGELLRLVDYYVECGDWRHADLMAEYLAALKQKNFPSKTLREWIVETVFAGEDAGCLKKFAGRKLYDTAVAEGKALSGAKDDASAALSPAEFARLRERKELFWAKDNRGVFNPADEVALDIFVKNIPEMRVSVYALDAAAAMRLGGDLCAIDLDSAVPTSQSIVRFNADDGMLRHRQTIKPSCPGEGFYIVECSGSGIASRALVRKGSFEVKMRRDASGYVFTGGDMLWIGEERFTADVNGEICVPFAPSPDFAGRATAVVAKGNLAAAMTFVRETESYTLDMAVALPPETLVAGESACALLRPVLRVNGVKTTCALLSDVSLDLVLSDFNGRERAEKIDGFSIEDDAESVVRFNVPENIAGISMRLSGTVKRMDDGKSERLAASWSRGVRGSISTDSIAQPFLRETESGYILEVLGRNGERIAGRNVEVSFSHVAFLDETYTAVLRTGPDGAISLGGLENIEEVRAAVAGAGEAVWRPADMPISQRPRRICIREGGEATVACRTGRIALTRVSDFSRPEVAIADATAKCAVSDGTVTLSGLEKGLYVLWLPQEDDSVQISVEEAPCPIEPDAPSLAIRDVSAADGQLRLKIANSSGDARVHIVAKRMLETAPEAPFAELAGTCETPLHPVRARSVRGSQYVSGRDLGYTLRYINERRSQGGHIGNMLDKPSLLLNPRQSAGTQKSIRREDEGGGWTASRDANKSDMAFEPMMQAMCREGVDDESGATYDFLPQAAKVFANIRPSADGEVVLHIPDGPWQTFDIVVTDGRTLVSRRISTASAPCEPRDRRKRGDVAFSRTEAEYEGTAALYSLAAGAASSDADLAQFAFIAKWSFMTDAEKRSLYGQYASHELDFFIYMKDRAFFDSAVAPHLANKRRKEFMDRWLLGEDLSQYAAAGALQRLNPLEQCLLAWRLGNTNRTSAKVSRMLADYCRDNPPDERECDRMLDIATLSSVPAASSTIEYDAAAAAGIAPESEDAETSAPLQKPRALAASKKRASAANAVVERRANARAQYRPPEETKEWVEAGWRVLNPSQSSRAAVLPDRFWRDFAAAVASGNTSGFASANILDAFSCYSTFASKIAAIALTDGPVAIKRAPAGDDGVKLATHFYEADGETVATGAFIAGEVYFLEATAMNPEPAKVRRRVRIEIPDGAIALGGCSPCVERTVELAPFASLPMPRIAFYFPSAEDWCGTDAMRVLGRRKGDTSSWRYVSQKAPTDDVLAWLAANSLKNANLSDLAWRFADGSFARKALNVLEDRGVFDECLWRAAIARPGTFDAKRARELLAACKDRLASRLGPALVAPLVEIDPEDCGIFVHKEYWPLVNARSHAIDGKGAATNESLVREWREFAAVLAAKRSLASRDRLLAAVFLAAQNRLREAEEQLALAAKIHSRGETEMQIDWMNVYFAFSRGDAASARKLAEKWVSRALPPWNARFRDALVQVDEASSRDASSSGASHQAPASAAASLAIKHSGGGRIAVCGRNISECILKAYPIDAEIAFSKNPFGDIFSNGGGFLGTKCAWSQVVKLGGEGVGEAFLDERLRNSNLVITANGTERLEYSPGGLDVQVVREWRQLRVRDSLLAPAAGAYVKVYARSADKRQTVFLKDGYTDMRGAFDYESVSDKMPFKPAEFAVFVQSATGQTAILRLAAR